MAGKTQRFAVLEEREVSRSGYLGLKKYIVSGYYHGEKLPADLRLVKWFKTYRAARDHADKLEKKWKGNPSTSQVPTHEVSGYVRRLPSGQIQVKIPLANLKRKCSSPKRTVKRKTVRRRRNIAGFLDPGGKFHPIRAGTRLKTKGKGKGKRKVKVADKRAYSRKKAGEKVKQTRKRKSNPKTHYEVIVGNVGTIYSGGSKAAALKRFGSYVSISKSGSGRAGGEDVTLMRDGEPIKEYFGTQSTWVE